MEDPTRSPIASVLVIDDDRDIAEVVQAVLTDEGYAVSSLYDLASDALMRTIGRLEPDVVLLDSGDPADYGPSWPLASAIHERSRPIPVVMFTAHQEAIEEAQEGASDRAVAAHFAAVVAKPFHLDDLLTTVATVARASIPFDRSPKAEAGRTQALVGALKRRGATEINPSKTREWALFRDRNGRLVQLYWWQLRGVYLVGRYDDEGILKMLGEFVERDAAINVALPG